jgi:hypothetical protein
MGYLLTLSISKLCGIGDIIINECETDGGMVIEKGN